ncbi:hypothetical protein Tco_1578357 [Tanacetum coccineum]
MALDSPFGQQAMTTPASPKTRSMSVNGDGITPPVFEEGQGNCGVDIYDFIKMQDMPEYQFSWGYRDIPVDRNFWLALACLDNRKQGWLQDYVSGVVLVSGNMTPWWRTMKRMLPEQLTFYLNEHGVLQSKGISGETFQITYMFPKVVEEAYLYGDYGVWVCIFLYRLSCKLPLIVDDSLQTAIAYHEWVLQYFWSHKVEAQKSLLVDEGAYQLIM